VRKSAAAPKNRVHQPHIKGIQLFASHAVAYIRAISATKCCAPAITRQPATRFDGSNTSHINHNTTNHRCDAIDDFGRHGNENVCREFENDNEYQLALLLLLL
jgi:hypothetical protein